MILDKHASDRYQEWRRFCDSLRPLPDDQQLLEVARYWGACPTVKFYIDWDNPKSWETPWELLQTGMLCPSGIAICMYHTLIISDEKWFDRTSIALVKDDTFGVFLVVLVDHTMALNLEINTVVTLKPALTTVLCEYKFLDGVYKEIENIA